MYRRSSFVPYLTVLPNKLGVRSTEVLHISLPGWSMEDIVYQKR